jgi:hypothetical protein
MGTIRLGAWVLVLVVSVKSAIRTVFANMDMRRDLRWRLVASMSSRPQGTMDFLLKWFEPMRKREISME